jgi:MFS family permease
MKEQLRYFFTNKRVLSLAMIFAFVGFLFGNWATFIPYVKEKFSLDDGELGLLLLSFPFGAAIGNPVSTIFINRLGANKTTILAMIFLALCYQLPLIVPKLPLVVIGLVITGVCLATTNIAMNTIVTAIERLENRFIMSSCHGMFSIGGMLGSTLASFSLGKGILPEYHMPAMAISICIATILLRNIILEIPEEKREANQPSTKLTMPSKILLGMIAISLCVNVAEGTMADWAAVYMKDVVKAENAYIGWGFAAYALFMAAGRFLGDLIVPRWGIKNILIVGGIVAASGLLLAVLMPNTICTIIGFTLVGAGVSCGAPILYGSASRAPNMAKGAGLALLNTFGILGFLLGPAIIGFISKAFSLPTAFIFVAILGLIWSFLSKRNRFY